MPHWTTLGNNNVTLLLPTTIGLFLLYGDQISIDILTYSYITLLIWDLYFRDLTVKYRIIFHRFGKSEKYRTIFHRFGFGIREI